VPGGGSSSLPLDLATFFIVFILPASYLSTELRATQRQRRSATAAQDTILPHNGSTRRQPYIPSASSALSDFDFLSFLRVFASPKKQ